MTEGAFSGGQLGDAQFADAHVDPSRLSRRAAMRAAAGGAVVAGIVLTPTVAGAAVSAYASSASGDDGTDDVTIDPVLSQANPAPFCMVKCCIQCWNYSGVFTKCAASTCACPTHKTCGTQSTDKLTGQLSVPKLIPPSSSIDLDYEIWGPTDSGTCTSGTTEYPAFSMTITGIDPPHQSCDVTVTVNCTTGTAKGGGSQTGITSDGSVTVNTDKPECTGSLVGGPPTAAKCPDDASVDIELSCTFS